MTEFIPREKSLYVKRSAAAVLIVAGLTGTALFAAGRANYPNLHTALDTAMCMLAGILALLLWDLGSRTSLPFTKWLAACFALTGLVDLLHVLVAVEWSGTLATITEMHDVWRPATWPVSAYLLAIGVGCVLLLARSGPKNLLGFAAALIVLGAGLLMLFHALRAYTAPGWLGITRPTLIAVPLLWAIIAAACWQRGVAYRLLPALTVLAAVLALANIAMLYSRAPHDTQAMVAHLGKVAGYLMLLLAVMEIASDEAVERLRAERELAHLNAELDHRVLERTAQLDAVNSALRALSERLTFAQEEERHNIAFELHEQLGQEVSTLKVHLQMLGNFPDNEAEGRRQNALVIVGRMLQRVRDMALDLRPPQLDDFGLYSALRAHCTQQAEAAGWVMHFDAPESGERPNPNIELACFRVVQEALTNITRHAKATAVWLRLHKSGNELHFSLRDNGVGFNAGDFKKGSPTESLGLIGMAERVRQVGGRIEINSTPHMGTEINAVFPLVNFDLSATV